MRPHERTPVDDCCTEVLDDRGTAGKLDLGGTVRIRDAASTIAWIRPFLPAFGITRVANVTGLDRIGLPVWMAIRPNGRSLSVSQGKGITDELAQASAMMESIECHHSEHVRPPDMVASHRTLRRRHETLSPRSLLPGIKHRSYDDGRPLAWIRGTDLGTGGDVYVPHVRVDLNWSEPHPDAGLFMVSSNGLASGNNLDEALLHAIFEVVERDSEWRWERLSPRAQRATEVIEASVATPILRRLLDQCAAAGIVTRIWDMTSEVGLPTYYSAITDLNPFGELDTFAGSGCHLSKEIALSRALTEAAQSRLTYIAGSRDDVFPSAYTPERGVYGCAPTNTPRVDFATRVSPPMGGTLADDLATTLGLLDRAGFSRVLAVDLTKPEYGIPVVQVLIPGTYEPDED